MSSEVKTQVVWLPDGFGGGEHAEVCRASDYAALEAERNELQRRLDAADEWATRASEQLKERDALAAHRQAQQQERQP